MRRGLLLTLFILIVSLISGCSANDPLVQSSGTLRTVFVGEKRPASAVTADEIERARATATGPLLLVEQVETGGQAILVEIGRNGDYTTYSNAAGQALTIRNGILISTRGLGYDLMSSDPGGSEQLVRAGTAGSSTRVYRHLDGEDQEFPTVFACTTERLRTGSVTGESDLRETCTSGDTTIVNSYRLRGGSLAESVQWVSIESGALRIEPL